MEKNLKKFSSCSKITLLMSLSIFLTCTCTKEYPWERLNERALTLWKQGRYSEAAKVAEEALGAAEKTFGPDHPRVAAPLNNLATFYNSQGKTARLF